MAVEDVEAEVTHLRLADSVLGLSLPPVRVQGSSTHVCGMLVLVLVLTDSLCSVQTAGQICVARPARCLYSPHYG